MFHHCFVSPCVCFPGLWHRTERHCISSASPMSWMQRTPSRAASVTRVFMGTRVFTLASQQRIQTTLTSVSTSNLQPTSYKKACRAKMVQYRNVTAAVPLNLPVFSFTCSHPAPQEKCWYTASWVWAAQPLWPLCIWCCGSVSLWGTLWGVSFKKEPFIPTGTSCLSSSNWMISWHSDGGCVLFCDICLSHFSPAPSWHKPSVTSRPPPPLSFSLYVTL